jgi:hypothetical protein
VGLRVDLDSEARGKMRCLCQGSNLGRSKRRKIILLLEGAHAIPARPSLKNNVTADTKLI